MVEVSAEIYKYWQVDYQQNVLKIIYQDGRRVEEALGAEYFADKLYIATSIFDWEKWWVISQTRQGHLVTTEGFNPNSPPPRGGRPSVYLDQNRWSAISRALHHPQGVANAKELEAARELAFLAADGGIVLPLSMAHMLETAGLYGGPRYELGVTMASLSAGWQMRNPLDLWKREAETTIHKLLGLSSDQPFYPISTEPGALFGEATGLGISDETPDEEKFMAMLTMPNVILSSLVEPDAEAKHPLTDWVKRHARITRQIDSEDLPKPQRRQVALRRYWNENIGFYTEPYRRLTRSPDFPMFSNGELKDMFSDSPMVGLLAELFVRRFVDRQSKWRRNDLMDMFYLSSASAYSEYVCAEKHTGTQLRDAQRTLGRRETVYTTLSDLVAAIRRDGVMGHSEREPDHGAGVKPAGGAPMP